MIVRFTLLTALLLTATIGARAQWVQTAGPEGAAVLAIAADGNRLFALIHDDICEYTGERWAVRGTIDGMYGTGGERLALREGILLANTRAGIIRSSDGGASWSATDLDGEIHLTAESFYVLSGSTILASSDGVRWTTLGAIPDQSGSPVFYNESIYTSEFYGSRVFRSDDGAQTWRAVELDLPLHGREVLAGSAVRLFAGTDALYAVAGSREILRSVDGDHWVNITHDLPEYSIIQNVVGGGDDLVIDVNTYGLYRLSGASWTRILAPTATAIKASGSGTIINTYSGVYRVAPGAVAAESLSRGLVRGPAFSMGSIGEIVLASTSDGIHRTVDGGASWHRVADFGSWQLGGFVENRGVLYTVDGVLYQSMDSGATWQMTGPKYDFEWEGPPYRTDVTGMDAAGGVVYIGVGTYLTGKGAQGWSSGGMFRSTDNGATWDDISRGLPNDGCCSYAPTGSVIATDEYVLINNAVGVYRSTDRGASWKQSMNGLPRQDPYIGHGEMLDLGTSIILRLGTTYYRSIDGGINWRPLEPSLPEGYAWMGVHSVVDGNLYTQATQRLNDTTYVQRLLEFNGRDWNDVTSMQPTGVQFGSFVRAGDFIYAGTTAHGVWRMNKSGVITPASTPIRNGLPGRTIDARPNLR